MTGAFRGISPASALPASVFFCAQLDDCALCLCDFLSACWCRATGFSLLLDPGPAVTAHTCLERRARVTMKPPKRSRRSTIVSGALMDAV